MYVASAHLAGMNPAEQDDDGALQGARLSAAHPTAEVRQ